MGYHTHSARLQGSLALDYPEANVNKPRRRARVWVPLTALLVSLLGCSNGGPTATGALSGEIENGLRAPPVINAHLHTAYLGMDDADYLQDVLQEMDDNGVQIAVLHINEPDDIDDWIHAAPGLFLAGPVFPCFVDGDSGERSCVWDDGDWPSIEWLRERYADGTFAIMGEMLFVYAGIAPDDSRMSPYWDLAAEVDVPVFVHINRGPPPDSPARPKGCCPNFDPDLGNPELLRPILTRHPQLRIVLQHAGFPAMPEFDGIDYLAETYAIMRDYPNVYADFTALNSAAPPSVHEAAVVEFIDRGLGDRIMFGSDNWETAPILERYRSFESLSDADRRKILFANARRFLRLDEMDLAARKSAPRASE